MKKMWWILLIVVLVIILVIAMSNVYLNDCYDKVRPDNVTFYGKSGNVIANIGTYSWSSKEVFGQSLHVNSCSVGPTEMDYKEILMINQGESIKTDLMYDVVKITTHKYDGDEVKQIKTELKYDETTQEINMADMDEGTYIIEVHAKEKENTVCYSFKLKILDEEK